MIKAKLGYSHSAIEQYFKYDIEEPGHKRGLQG